MASFIEAVEDTLRGEQAFVKFALLAVPVFCSYYLFKQNDMANFYIFGGATAIILLTFMTMVFDNIRNCRDKSLPGFNPIPFIVTMVKLIFAIGPICVALYFLANFLLAFDVPIDVPNIQKVYAFVVFTFLGSFLLISYMMFAKSGNIFAAYNLPVIIKHSVDVVPPTFFYLFLLALLNLIVVGSIVYVFNVLWNTDNVVFTAICSYILVINVGISGNYLAQIHYEAIPKQKGEDSDSLIS